MSNEPVAWFYHRLNETGRFMCADAEAMKKIEGQDYVITPLYDTPQLKPLNHGEILDIYLKLVDGNQDLDIMEFAQIIQERHGIK